MQFVVHPFLIHSSLLIWLCISLQNNSRRIEIMPKGPEKNTKNKALHTKLLHRKKAKLQEEKKEKSLRLKALVAKINQQKSTN